MIAQDEIERCIPWIEDALEYNGQGVTLEDVLDGLQLSMYKLWAQDDGCCVTELKELPNGCIVNIFLGAGSMSAIEKCVISIEAYAKCIGATKVVLFGRRGWEKTFLRDRGFKTPWTLMVKEI